MIIERNMLMERAFPRLKELCREKFGLEFQVKQNHVLLCYNYYAGNCMCVTLPNFIQPLMHTIAVLSF